ncbi:hypothetical protein [Streptosporangium subroseum]|nr:hypothetical protein OHB15_00435 [Streptosporangium subroseum]
MSGLRETDLTHMFGALREAELPTSSDIRRHLLATIGKIVGCDIPA